METREIKNLEIFRVGQWNGDKYTAADLQGMVAAFNQVGFKPTVKCGHESGQEDEATARKAFGAPALGYVSALRLNGDRLVADLEKIPKNFYELIKAGAYSRVSAEVYWSFADSGKTFPRVLKSVAFLGCDIPAIVSLKEIEGLYQRDAFGRVHAYDAQGQEFRVYGLRSYTIEKRGDAFVLLSHEGKVLGTHGTREEAEAQERAIEANKHKDHSKEVRAYMSVKEKDGKWCVVGEDGEVISEHDSEEAAKAAMKPEKEEEYRMKDDRVKEYERKAREAEDKLEAAQREYKDKLEAAAAAKEATERENESLASRLYRLETASRDKEIDAWVTIQRGAGKLLPVEAPKVKALLRWLPDGDHVRHYSQDGKVRSEEITYLNKDGKEDKTTVGALVKSFIETRNSIFKELSHADPDEPNTKAYERVEAEVADKVKSYMAEKGEKVYLAAMKAVLDADLDLKDRYNRVRQ